MLSLVIPCCNEAKNLPLLLSRCAEIVRLGDVEVVLVDNGSIDETPQLLTELLSNNPRCRSVRIEKNQGYGYGILFGLRAAKGSLLGWTHADMQTDPVDVLRGLELFKHYGDNIFIKGRRYGRRPDDVFFTVGMSVFETVLLGCPLWDINAQPTLFSRDFFETWENAPHDFALDLYVYYQAKRMGLMIQRFPVHYGKRANGVSHWNVGWGARQKFIQRTINYSLALRRDLHKPVKSCR